MDSLTFYEYTFEFVPFSPESNSVNLKMDSIIFCEASKQIFVTNGVGNLKNRRLKNEFHENLRNLQGLPRKRLE